jgi:hypothetical protein
MIPFSNQGTLPGVALLTTRQAASYMGFSPRTLEDWRLKGCGPVFRKFPSSVRYKLDDLASFIAQAARTNTGGGIPA